MDGTTIIQTGQRVTMSSPVTIHSSLNAIAAVCEEVMALDLQEGTPSTTGTQKSGFYPLEPSYLGSHPKTGVPVCATSSVGGPPASIDRDDRMIRPYIFKQIQKLCNHTFTLDACANNFGDNVLCLRYCSPEDSFLSRDLQGEFAWLNPPFKRANEFLEAYFRSEA